MLPPTHPIGKEKDEDIETLEAEEIPDEQEIYIVLVKFSGDRIFAYACRTKEEAIDYESDSVKAKKIVKIKVKTDSF